jgi:hypothetical protein
MQRAKLRRWILVVVVLLAAASMFPSIGGSSRPSAPHARHATLTAKYQQVSAGAPSHTTPVRADP